MITRFHVENYKALRGVTLELTPIHVLIGPNDSGKTSIFEALTALSRTTEQDLAAAFGDRWQGRELVWRGLAESSTVRFEVWLKDDQSAAEYQLDCKFPDETGRSVIWGLERGTVETKGPSTSINMPCRSSQHSTVGVVWRHENLPEYLVAKAVHDGLSSLQCFRWVPSHLALPVAFGSAQPFRMEATGFRLPLVLDDIIREDHLRFAKLEARFRDFFPYVQRIKLPQGQGFNTLWDPQPSARGVQLRFELMNGDGILPAAQASDGLLLVLAYLAILHLPEPPRILLIEEPENGIHPQRLKEVLNMLKELVKEQCQTQVLLTTHSPYVVDCFEPAEVTLCLKNEEGAVTVHRLSESKTVREQIDTFSLGEIWTAEGDEALAGQTVAN